MNKQFNIDVFLDWEGHHLVFALRSNMHRITPTSNAPYLQLMLEDSIPSLSLDSLFTTYLLYE